MEKNFQAWYCGLRERKIKRKISTIDGQKVKTLMYKQSDFDFL